MRSTTTATALSKRIVTPPAAVGSKGLASELPLSALGLHGLSDEPVRRGAALARHGHGIAGSDRAKRLPIDTGGIHDDRATVGCLELQLGHANGFDRPSSDCAADTLAEGALADPPPADVARVPAVPGWAQAA